MRQIEANEQPMCRDGEGATNQNVPIPRTMKRPSTFVVKERLNLLGKPTIVYISFLSAIQVRGMWTVN